MAWVPRELRLRLRWAKESLEAVQRRGLEDWRLKQAELRLVRL